jgi:hypothetical protein
MSSLNFNVDLSGFSGDKPPVDLTGFGGDSLPHIPPGWHVATVRNGELTISKTSIKPMYVLDFLIAEGKYAGCGLKSYHMMDNPLSRGRAYQAISPLGITTEADIRGVYPPVGKTVYARIFVVFQTEKDGKRKTYTDGTPIMAIERFEPHVPAPKTLADYDTPPGGVQS